MQLGEIVEITRLIILIRVLLMVSLRNPTLSFRAQRGIPDMLAQKSKLQGFLVAMIAPRNDNLKCVHDNTIEGDYPIRDVIIKKDSIINARQPVP